MPSLFRFLNQKKISVLFFAAWAISLTGCVTKQQELSKIWIYSFSTESSNSSELSTDNSFSLSGANFVNLMPDGKYTADLGFFEYGSWKYSGDSLYLTNSKNDVHVFAILARSDNEMKIKSADNFILLFNALSFSSADKTNPYAIENNLWRVKPSHAESDKALSARLQNHFKFWEQYFKWGLDNNIQYMDVRSTPSLIKMYGNGFALNDYGSLSDEWRSYFFDDSDCHKATMILSNIIEEKNISWPPADNKYKFFIAGFRQVQEFLKQ